MFSLYLNLALHCVNAFQNDVTLQTLQTMVKECYLHFLLARFWFSSGLTPWLSRHIQLIGFTYMNGGTYHSEMHGAPWDADAEDFHLWQAMTPFLFFQDDGSVIEQCCHAPAAPGVLPPCSSNITNVLMPTSRL